MALQSLAGGEQIGKPFSSCPAARDLHEAARDQSNHFIKEAVTREFQFKKLIRLTHIDAVNGARGLLRQQPALRLRHVAPIG